VAVSVLFSMFISNVWCQNKPQLHTCIYQRYLFYINYQIGYIANSNYLTLGNSNYMPKYK